MKKSAIRFLLVLLPVIAFSSGLLIQKQTGLIKDGEKDIRVSQAPEISVPAESEKSANYTFLPDKMYRMPTHFGPSLGPRQGENGKRFACKGNPKTISVYVSFLTNREQLERLLPEGFSVGESPIVTVAASYMTEIEWLAGRGYNVLGVSFPAVFNGKEDRATGDFLLVLWENFADPIITGREELGFSKIYCELPEPLTYLGETHCIASWMGFKFLDLKVMDLKKVAVEEASSGASTSAGDTLTGVLHYKYIPKTGEWGQADVAYAVLTPSGNSNEVVKEAWEGQGKVEFHKARWEDMPTQYTIVNTFAGLEIKKYTAAGIYKTVGGKDLSDQRILR